MHRCIKRDYASMPAYTCTYYAFQLNKTRFMWSIDPTAIAPGGSAYSIWYSLTDCLTYCHVLTTYYISPAINNLPHYWILNRRKLSSIDDVQTLLYLGKQMFLNDCKFHSRVVDEEKLSDKNYLLSFCKTSNSWYLHGQMPLLVL